MKLREYAKRNSITYRTAYQHFRDGHIEGAYRLGTGTIVVPEPKVESVKPEYTVVYVRVSSSENKDNLESQAERVTNFCTANGWVVHQVVKECGSGLNDNRTKLLKLLSERKATRIVVEHKDRLTRFGFNYIATLLSDCEIIVINQATNDKDDLIQDFTSVITSFCARIYGQRRSRRKTEQLIRELKDDPQHQDVD